MGTNYYWRSEPRKCCGLSKEHEHIGKSSWGWTFSFQATEEIRSYAQWLEKLQKGVIEDEYNRQVTLEDFKALVEEKRDAKNNHALYCKDTYPSDWRTGQVFVDDEGNSFSEYEFF